MAYCNSDSMIASQYANLRLRGVAIFRLISHNSHMSCVEADRFRERIDTDDHVNISSHTGYAQVVEEMQDDVVQRSFSISLHPIRSTSYRSGGTGVSPVFAARFRPSPFGTFPTPQRLSA